MSIGSQLGTIFANLVQAGASISPANIAAAEGAISGLLNQNEANEEKIINVAEATAGVDMAAAVKKMEDLFQFNPPAAATTLVTETVRNPPTTMAAFYTFAEQVRTMVKASTG